jgi:hypothetical protein
MTQQSSYFTRLMTMVYVKFSINFIIFSLNIIFLMLSANITEIVSAFNHLRILFFCYSIGIQKISILLFFWVINSPPYCLSFKMLSVFKIIFSRNYFLAWRAIIRETIKAAFGRIEFGMRSFLTTSPASFHNLILQPLGGYVNG